MQIAIQNNAIIIRGSAIALGKACCCCPCPSECEVFLTVDASIGGMAVSKTVSVPGAGDARFEKNDGSGDYISIDVTILCGQFGEQGECGWLVAVGVCYQSDGVVNGELFEAFLALDEDFCPDAGSVDLQCVFLGCNATVTAAIA